MHDSTSSIRLPDGVPRSLPRLPVAASPGRRHRSPIRSAGFVACFDSLAAVTAIVVVFVAVNLSYVQMSADSFLSARVTVKNVLLLITLGTAWPIVFRV